jgi:uncharacterized membrane protein YkvA (DUF1232 family)
MTAAERVHAWAGRLRQDVVALWFACRHPDMPRLPKAIGMFAVAYALSPIDLIPDFIPVLGVLDDLVLLPALIWLALRWTPPALLEESRGKAREWIAAGRARPTNYAAAVAIVVIWLAAAVLIWRCAAAT